MAMETSVSDSPQRVRNRIRSISGGSDVSDHFHVINERRVDDISLAFFYKPHTITLLTLSILWLVYQAFTRDDSVTEENVAGGIWAIIFFFVIVSVLAFPNGPFVRPHPAFWRVVFGMSVLYFLFLVFAIFQNYKTVKAMLVWTSPELQNFTLVVQDHAQNCWDVTFIRVWNSLDVYVFGHIFGWALKTLLIRHWGVCVTISITWEITELCFYHVLPNFAECWWDALFLDIIICNNLGIFIGMKICHFFEIRTYFWESVKDIQTTTGKITRCVMQFTPASWSHSSWLDPKSSYMRVIGVGILVIFFQVSELNTFFLKHIFEVPTNQRLNYWRIILIGFISAPSIRQYYSYLTDTQCTRLGVQAWVFVAVTFSELIVCIKFGMETFKMTQINNLLIWAVCVCVSTTLSVYICVKVENYFRSNGADGGPPTYDTDTTPSPSPRVVGKRRSLRLHVHDCYSKTEDVSLPLNPGMSAPIREKMNGAMEYDDDQDSGSDGEIGELSPIATRATRRLRNRAYRM